MRRLVDIIVAGVGLAVLAVPMMIIAALIRVRMGGPVIFTHQRMGLNKQPFQIYKFRSMTNARDAHGQLLSDEQRVTRLGWLLRRTSVDELPQLFNILKGDMSLIGPRPNSKPFPPEFDARYDVRPGLTGLAQVSVRRDREKTPHYDLEYVRNRSVLMDAQILVKTFNAVASGRGTGPAYNPHAQKAAASKPQKCNFKTG